MAAAAAAAKGATRAATAAWRRCVIVPGNGCDGDVRDANWYGWLADKLTQRGMFDKVVLPEPCMPDPLDAHEAEWVPHIEKVLMEEDWEGTVLIGHSSGAEAAMRLLEKRKKGETLAGTVLVGFN